jgi:hypothetical protein
MEEALVQTVEGKSGEGQKFDEKGEKIFREELKKVD